MFTSPSTTEPGSHLKFFRDFFFEDIPPSLLDSLSRSNNLPPVDASGKAWIVAVSLPDNITMSDKVAEAPVNI